VAVAGPRGVDEEDLRARLARDGVLLSGLDGEQRTWIRLNGRSVSPRMCTDP
jgi:hypothetical protein